MTRNLSKRDIEKKVKYLLNSVHISFSLAKALKWRQLYKLLKKAAKLDDKFEMPKNELKDLAKQIVSEDPIQSAEAVATLFEIEIRPANKTKEVEFEFVPFEKPFLELFLDKHPLLLI